MTVGKKFNAIARMVFADMTRETAVMMIFPLRDV